MFRYGVVSLLNKFSALRRTKGTLQNNLVSVDFAVQSWSDKRTCLTACSFQIRSFENYFSRKRTPLYETISWSTASRLSL